MKAGFSERLAGRLSPPEHLVDGYDPMLAVAQRLQLAVGAATLVAVWALPPYEVREQLVLTVLVLGVYLPWSLLSRRSARMRHGALARVLHLVFDLGAVGVFPLVLPATRTAAMFAYTLVVVFHAKISGRAAGLVVGGGAVGLVLLAEWGAPADERHGAFTVVMFGVVLAALAVLVDALAAERRRTARHLSRLQRALEHLAAEPTLSATTDSIASAARDAVGAVAVAVLLPHLEDGEVRVVGQSGFPTGDVIGAELRTAVRHLDRQPGGLAMATGRVVTIPDLGADERWAATAHVVATYDVASMISVPLGPPSNPIGVLNAYFSDVEAFDEDDVHLLRAYGRQASTAVARALAFEQERRAAAQVADANRLKSDFVSTVSHELRTPLTSISGFIDTVLLRWDQLTDHEKRELLHRSAWNAGELRRLIEQVLTFSALDGAEATVERRPYACGRASRSSSTTWGRRCGTAGWSSTSPTTWWCWRPGTPCTT